MKTSNKKLLKQLSQLNDIKTRGVEINKNRAKRVIALLLVVMFMFASLSPAMNILGFASADDAIEAEVNIEDPADPASDEDPDILPQDDEDPEDEQDTDFDPDASDEDDPDENTSDDDDIIDDIDDNDDIIDDDDNMDFDIMGAMLGIELLNEALSGTFTIALQLEDRFGSNPGRGEENRDIDVTITNKATGDLIWSGRQTEKTIELDVPGLE